MSTLYHHLMKLMCIAVLTSCNGENNNTAEFIPKKIDIKETSDPKLMELTNEGLTFIDPRGVKWVAPKGTLTDGASVPRIALPITDGRFSGKFLKAAVVHDAYCQKENETQTPKQYRSKPWKAVHRMFYEGILAGGTSPSLALTMYFGVWIGGPRWDDPDRDLQNVSNEMLRVAFNSGKKWIEDSNPTPEEVEAWMDKREPALIKISQLESIGLSALRDRDLSAADTALQQTEEYLKSALGKLPNDSMLLNLKGYLYKNRALKYRELDMGDKVKDELDKAEKVLQKVITIEPQDPSALNGLGSIFIIRGDLDRAEEYIDKALNVDPSYPAAKRDLRRIKHLREYRLPE